MTKPEKTCYSPDRQAGAKNRVFACTPPEMVSAVEWVLDEFEGEISRATLVQQLLEAVFQATPDGWPKARREASKNKHRICKSPRRRAEDPAGMMESQ